MGFVLLRSGESGNAKASTCGTGNGESSTLFAAVIFFITNLAKSWNYRPYVCRMAKISSKTLFHFVNRREFLIDIITEGFWPRYCIEHCWGERHWAIPMVCFCDITLSDIQLHTKKYGNYGIGVSKSWAGRNNVTPVLYAHYESDLYNRIKECSMSLKSPCTSESNISLEEYMLYRIKRTTESPYEHMYNYPSNADPTPKMYKLYNEREWRYVPHISSNVHMVEWKAMKGWFDKPIEDRIQEKREFCNELCESTKDLKLDIGCDDIKYLFVPDEKEKRELIEAIYSAESISLSRKKKFISKIVTIENISEDF